MAGVDALGLIVVVPSVMTVPFRGELHTAADIDVTLVGEFVLVIHIAEYGIGNPGMDSLQHVFFVDRGIHAVLPEQR